MPCKCFRFNWFKVVWFNRPVPFWILSVKSFMTLVKFALSISWVNFLEILMLVDDMFGEFKSFWIVFPSSSDSGISLYVHWWMRCSNAFKWSLDFSYWHGFWRTWYCCDCLECISFIDDSCNHSAISLAAFSMTYCPARP